MVEINSMITIAIVATAVTLAALALGILSPYITKVENASNQANKSSKLNSNPSRQTKDDFHSNKSKKSKKNNGKEKKISKSDTVSQTSMAAMLSTTDDDFVDEIIDVKKKGTKQLKKSKKSDFKSEIKFAIEEARNLETEDVYIPDDEDDIPLESAVPQVHRDDWAVVEIKKSAKAKSKGSSNSSNAALIQIEEVVKPVVIETVVPASTIETIDKITEDVFIPAKKVGAIIGVKGSVKLSIQNASGAELSLPKVDKESTEPVPVTITGSAENVKKAKKAIQDLISKGFAPLLEGEDFRETQVPVHHKSLPEIIGKGGSNLRAIQDQLQVRITVPTTSSSSSTKINEEVKNVKIGISGMKDNVIKAKAIIKELLLYYHTPITHPGVVHEELDIPSNYYNHIIGSKGSEIKHIQGNFKVSVHIPNLDSVNKNVVIVGSPPNVENARKYILKVIDNVIQGRSRPAESRGKVPVAEEDQIDIIPIDYETRATEVSIGDLLQTAKHVKATSTSISTAPVLEFENSHESQPDVLSASNVWKV